MGTNTHTHKKKSSTGLRLAVVQHHCGCGPGIVAKEGPKTQEGQHSNGDGETEGPDEVEIC